MGIKEFIKLRHAKQELGSEKYRTVVDTIKDSRFDRDLVYGSEYRVAKCLIGDLKRVKSKKALASFMRVAGIASTIGVGVFMRDSANDFQQMLLGAVGAAVSLGFTGIGVVDGVKANVEYKQRRNLLKNFLRTKSDDKLKQSVCVEYSDETINYAYDEKPNYSVSGIQMTGITQDACLNAACDELAEGM